MKESSTKREQKLEAALRLIADNTDCECDHTTEDCCVKCDPVDYFCPGCVAAVALKREAK